MVLSSENPWSDQQEFPAVIRTKSLVLSGKFLCTFRPAVILPDIPPGVTSRRRKDDDEHGSDSSD
jgi:hypothetical protein